MANVSVIIPVFNSEDTIANCIESVLNQIYSDIELILVDDGSNDKSGIICDEYARKDNRIKVIHQINKGRTQARYIGLKQSNCEWINYVDSDDILPQDSIYNLYKRTSDRTDIIFGNGYTLPYESRNIIPIHEFRHMTVRGEGTIGVPWGSLYRKSIIPDSAFDLPRDIINGEDYIFWLRLLFNSDLPVSIVYENVYFKGKEHTSNCFIWTVDYAYRLNEYRKNSIPVNNYTEFLSDMIDDRIANLFSVTLYTKRKEWINSQFYIDILYDLQKLNKRLSFKQCLFLSLPSIRLRKLYSVISKYKSTFK